MANDPLDDEADSEEEAAFSAFVQLLFSDASMDRCFPLANRVVWDKGTQDTAWPSEARTPWIRLTPNATGSKQHTRGDRDQPLRIMVETCVSGLSAAKRMRAWAVIRRALRSLDPTMTRSLAKFGVRQVDIVKPCYGVDAINDSNGLVISQGTIDLLLNVPG